MPIAYIVHPNTPKIRRWLPKKVDLVFVFESDGELGRAFAQKGIDAVSLRTDGTINYRNIVEDDSMVKNAKKANYILWRKFMVLYHFKTVSVDRQRRKRAFPGYMMDTMRRFVRDNKNYRRAYDAMDKLEVDIRESVVELLRRECSDYDRMERQIDTLMDISEKLYYGYMAHQGCNTRIASIFQSHYYYIVINLLLKYGLDGRDFDSEERPTEKLLTILCRIFNESIVHRSGSSLPEKYGHIDKAFSLIDRGEFDVEAYLDTNI